MKVIIDYKNKARGEILQGLKDTGYSQYRVCRSLKISPINLSRFLKGSDRVMSVKILKRIIRYLHREADREAKKYTLSNPDIDITIS
jgi:transcriptional regulator with XRE-family HTH domain